MFDFKFSLILGYTLAEIKISLKQVEDIHLGLFISDLMYKTEKEGQEKKKDFYLKLSTAIREINKEIKSFNLIIKHSNGSLSPLKEINPLVLKTIIEKHKGDYPRGRFIDELTGIGDSPSVLAKKHTALLIHNVLMETNLSMKDFLRSLEVYLSPFKSIDYKKVRKSTETEIKKIKAIYSIGCLGEAVFMTGRLLENIITQYLLLIRMEKLINLSISYIKSNDFKFDNKIDYLYNKKAKFVSSSQWAKMKSVKWDRNLYGHNSRTKPKDANAVVTIGLQSIELLEQKIRKLKA